MNDLQHDLQRSLLLLRTLLLAGGEVEAASIVRQTVEEVITLLQRNAASGVSASDGHTVSRPAG